MIELAGVGYRHRLQIGGEHYYLVVDQGQMRQVLERVCAAATEMLRRGL